jgi:hypothetical protein
MSLEAYLSSQIYVKIIKKKSGITRSKCVKKLSEECVYDEWIFTEGQKGQAALPPNVPSVQKGRAALPPNVPSVQIGRVANTKWCGCGSDWF